MQDKEYMAVMIQSLEKKREILDLIIEKNREQKILFSEEDSDPEQVGRSIKSIGRRISASI